ncbi:MAG: hypothetical protein MI861_23715, partial [Pirellulales bacterium]|nr:hypothetical protein [Pirellulales bacterium]
CQNGACNESLGRLRPSIHGIFQARCRQCGQWTSTMAPLLERATRKSCRKCDVPFDVPQIGRCREYSFAVLGTRGSGKTYVLVKSLGQLFLAASTSRRLKIAIPRPSDRENLTSSWRNLRSGQPPQPLPLPPVATNVWMRERTERWGKLLYFYEVPEHHIDGTDQPAAIFNRSCDGLMLVVCPEAKHFSLDAVLSMVSQYLEHQLGASIHTKISVPLAVVVNPRSAMEPPASTSSDCAADSFDQERLLRRFRSRFLIVRVFAFPAEDATCNAALNWLLEMAMRGEASGGRA